MSESVSTVSVGALPMGGTDANVFCGENVSPVQEHDFRLAV